MPQKTLDDEERWHNMIPGTNVDYSVVAHRELYCHQCCVFVADETVGSRKKPLKSSRPFGDRFATVHTGHRVTLEVREKR